MQDTTTLEDVRKALWNIPSWREAFWVCGNMISTRPNEYATWENDEYATWDAILQIGRNYLVGDDVPMARFIQSHTSRLEPWQKVAYRYALSHPAETLRIESSSRAYVFRKRGEYVEIGLPYHDKGGERYWASKDGKTRVLINVD